MKRKVQGGKTGMPMQWGKYLKEFLMIFLAITFGFFVENWREDLADKEMEKELMHELVENLRFDTLRYHTNFAINALILADMDTLREELTKAYEGKGNPNRLHHYAFRTNQLSSLALLNTNAITELRSSGALRLMENKALRNKLADYYERRVRAMDGIDRPSEELGNQLRLWYTRFFSMRDMDDVLKKLHASVATDQSSLLKDLEQLRQGPPRMIYAGSKSDIDQYISTLGLFQMQLITYQRFMLENKWAATDLMKEIRIEYGFE